MALLQAVAIFTLCLPLSSTVTLTCNNLITPLNVDSHSALTGKWIILAMAASEDLQPHMATLKSSWIELSKDDQSRLNTVRWVDKINTDCVAGSGDVSYSGNEVNMNYNSKTYKGKYLQTCPDCLLYTDESEGNVPSYMFLAKREGSVLQESERDTFRKQADCVNLSQITFYQGGADLCPDERAQQ